LDGSVQTLTINTRYALYKRQPRERECASIPRLRRRSELGAAWKQRSSGENPRDYLSVKLDDPSLPEAISAALFEAADGKKRTGVE